MIIGEAAHASGVSAKMIRYYESIGLIRPAKRSFSGYRQYTEADVHTLRFIRRARSLGFPVDEIQQLATLWQDTGRASADVKRIALNHVAALEAKIEGLQAMVRTLRHLADHCHGDARPDCPILDDLASGTGRELSAEDGGPAPGPRPESGISPRRSSTMSEPAGSRSRR